MSVEIKIVFAEDQLILRQALIPLLADYNIITIAEAENGIELLAVLKTKMPDIILLDYEMPLMNGDEALYKIKEFYPKAKIIFLTQHDSEPLREYLYSKGANYFLNKNTDIEKIVEVIREVHLKKQATYQSKNKVKIKFSKKEIAISPLICQGKSNKEIASSFNISEKTVEGHKNNLFKKTNTLSAHEFVSFINVNRLHHLK